MRLHRSLLVVLLVVRTALGGVNGWTDGEVGEAVEIRVLSGDESKPITGASVWLLTYKDAAEYKWAKRNPEMYAKEKGPIERLGSRVATNAEGVVKVWTKFRAAWHDNPDGTTRINRIFDGIVIVEAEGFLRFESTLEPLIPRERPVSLVITVELQPEGESGSRR